MRIEFHWPIRIFEEWPDVYKVWKKRSYARHALDRLRKGVSYRDCWSFDEYLGHILIETLPKYKIYDEESIRAGYPMKYEYKPNGERRSKKGVKKQKHLHDMKIDAIIGALHDTYYGPDFYAGYERLQLALKVFAEMYGCFWW